MNVVLNSDLIYATYLIEENLPAPLQNLCESCVEQNVPIVVPETTLLEFNNKQQEHADRERSNLRKAFDRLDKYEIEYQFQDPDQLIVTSDLISLLKQTGASVELMIPNDEELREAHRRACLHEPPLSSDSRGNEMRDLIIWLIALRVARDRGGALLLSADRVHTSDYGESEATSFGLLRANSIEAGLELLEFVSPSAELVRELMEPAWQGFIEAGLAIELPIQVSSVKNSRFVQGIGGIGSASFRLKGLTATRETLLSDVKIESFDNIRRIALSDVFIKDESYSDIAIEIEMLERADDYEDRLSGLKDILGE